MNSAGHGGRSRVRFRTTLVVVVILLMIAAVVVAANLVREDNGYDSAADCVDYGIQEGDALATAEPVMKSASLNFPFIGRASETSDSYDEDGRWVPAWETGDYEDAEGVELGREFSAHQTSGRYHLFTRGVDFSQPVGLVIRLHGDGAEEYLSPGGLSACLAKVAESHNMITLVPHTPDTRTATWWMDLGRSLGWVNALVEEISEQHGVASDDTWWMGYSGGAELISYGLIPRVPEAITGGAIMLGGGGAPTGTSLDMPDDVRATMPLHWVTGQRDNGTDPREPFDAIAAAREGSQWYSDRGFENVHTNFPTDLDHFSLPQAAILRDILAVR